MSGNNKSHRERTNKKITMKDIANYLNIDRTTVSKAMAENPGVSDSMVQKVRKAAEELGYRKDIFASGLTTGKNSLLGLVMLDMTRGIYAPLVAQFQQTARKYNYGIILQFVGSNHDDVVHTIDLLKQQRVSGATFISDATTKAHNHLLVELVESGIAVNTTRRDFIHDRIDTIRFDNQKAGYDAANHMIKLGHTRIAFTGSGNMSGTPAERLDGYLKAMGDAGLQPEIITLTDHLSQLQGDQVQQAYHGFLQAWRNRIRPSAVVCMNDSVALGVLYALKDEGVSVPGQVSILGFDDLQSVLAVPRITSSRIPLAEAGVLAVQMLMERMKKPEMLSVYQMLDCELIVRESTATPR